MLITTGKNPSQECRALARALFCVLPHSVLEGRGKRSLSSLITKARKKRMGSICAIYREEGGQHSLSSLSLSETGYDWLSPKILVEKITLHSPLPKKSEGQSSSVKITGARAKEVRGLFGAEPTGDEPESAISAGAKSISLSFRKKKLITLGVSYEE